MAAYGATSPFAMRSAKVGIRTRCGPRPRVAGRRFMMRRPVAHGWVPLFRERADDPMIASRRLPVRAEQKSRSKKPSRCGAKIPTTCAHTRRSRKSSPAPPHG